MLSKKISGPGEVSFYGWFFFTHLAQLSEILMLASCATPHHYATYSCTGSSIFQFVDYILIMYCFFFFISYIFI